MGELVVVTGLIIRQGRVLLEQRRADRELPLQWACPGGKVEREETAGVALARELKEELGVEAVIGEFIACSYFSPSEARPAYKVRLFLAEIGNQNPKPLDAAGLGWFLPSEIVGLKLAPSLSRAYGAVLEWVETHPGAT
jgi:8-oxo-dGTP diphosphatase